MAYDLKVLDKGCEELGITLNEVQKQQFITFYEYLVEKNKVMNLTGITEFQEVLVKHFLDSLACVKAVEMNKINKIFFFYILNKRMILMKTKFIPSHMRNFIIYFHQPNFSI